MRLHKFAHDGYGAVQVATGVATADNVRLIMMLFDGLLESLSVTRGHIQYGNTVEKGRAITRASRIVLGLQGALDLERGGDLARNLNELYSYVTRRLLHVNARNDLDALEEIRSLIGEIHEAWQSLPSLVPSHHPAAPALN